MYTKVAVRVQVSSGEVYVVGLSLAHMLQEIIILTNNWTRIVFD